MQAEAKPITKADLPKAMDWIGNVEPIRPILYCDSCGGEWSATPGDYFMLPADYVFKCNTCGGVPMRLVTKRTVYQDWPGVA